MRRLWYGYGTFHSTAVMSVDVSTVSFIISAPNVVEAVELADEKMLAAGFTNYSVHLSELTPEDMDKLGLQWKA